MNYGLAVKHRKELQVWYAVLKWKNKFITAGVQNLLFNSIVKADEADDEWQMKNEVDAVCF